MDDKRADASTAAAAEHAPMIEHCTPTTASSSSAGECSAVPNAARLGLLDEEATKGSPAPLDEQPHSAMELRQRHRRDVVAIGLLVVFLFLHEFQPSQPFLVPYWKRVLGVPVQSIFDSIFPWATYSMLFMGAAAASSLWLLGLRPTLFLSAVAACLQTAFSVWGDNDKRYAMLVISEVVWAFGFGSLFVVLVAKFTLVPRRFFHTISSLNKGASMIAVLLSSLLGQLIVDNYPGSTETAYKTTFYITIASTALAALLVLFMPKPHSVPRSPRDTLVGILDAYKTEKGNTVMWAVIYMVVQADSFLLVTYWQTLFNKIDSHRTINGYVFAAARTCGAVSSLLPAIFHLIGFHSWKKFPTLICSVATACAGALVVGLTYCNSLLQAMPIFCAQHAFTEIIEVICLAQVAIGVQKTPTAEYGWVFGMNFFLSITIQVVIQAIIQTLEIKQGYRVLGGILIANCFLVLAFAVMRKIIENSAARRNAMEEEVSECDSQGARNHDN